MEGNKYGSKGNTHLGIQSDNQKDLQKAQTWEDARAPVSVKTLEICSQSHFMHACHLGRAASMDSAATL